MRRMKWQILFAAPLLARLSRPLLREWVASLRHLKEDSPCLFSPAARMNPFDPGASALVS